MNNVIYLDNNSTTPVDERILNTVLPFLKNQYGNPASTHHLGLEIKKYVTKAKEQIAKLINADSKEITITSGATESINLALKGLALHANNTKKHIITAQTEHKAVLDTCKYLETIGFDIEYLPVTNDGLIDLELLKSSIKKNTLLICIMWVNNETGVIQPIKEICEIAHNHNTLFMTDATQAVGKIKTDVIEEEIDLMCFSAHKMYGLKGCGALFINKDTINTRNILPLQHGGGHENGLRSGTLNVPAIIGFGKACEIALYEMGENAENIRVLRDELENELLKLKGVSVNGNKTQRLFNTLNICIPHFDANIFIGKNRDIAVSNGSACTSALVQPSHVLSAMGLSEDEALGSIRIGLSKYNSKEEIHLFMKTLINYLNS